MFYWLIEKQAKEEKTEGNISRYYCLGNTVIVLFLDTV